MEKYDIYDLLRNKTGRTAQRGSKSEEGDYRLAVTVCIFNSKDQMLIQQRQPFKDDWSNMWDFTAAGSAVYGETPQMAVERELFEELGLKISFQGIRPNFTVNFDKGFNDFFLLEKDIELNTLVLQYDEVKSVKWAGKSEILTMIKQGEFITYYPALVEFLFDSRKSYGSHFSENLKY